jgi:hypothetical protein
MTDLSQQPNTPVDRRTLAKASGGALLVAGLVLVGAVLPAEYGVDPTGLGGALGLTGMAQAAAATPADAAPATATLQMPDMAAIVRTGDWREDSLTITLAPHSGQEVKAHMASGDSFLFAWESAGGPVRADMHGEATNAAEGEFTSYWDDREIESGQGVFTAPFAGTHGWYWRNKGDTPVTVTVRLSGFYQDVFQPAGN